MKEEVFKWFDAHDLTSEEAGDLDYLLDILSNFEENEEVEFEEEEAMKLALDYQIYFRKKLENIG